MINFPSDLVARIVSVLLNVFSGLIVLIILVTIPTVPKQEEREKKVFILTSVLVLFSVIVDSINTILWRRMEYRNYYVVLASVECILSVLTSAAKSIFVLLYLDRGKKINKIFQYFSMVVYSLLFILILFDPFFSLVYDIPDDKCELVFGPLEPCYSILVLLGALAPFLAVLLNWKKLGTRSSLFLLIVQVLPLLTYFLLWEVMPPALLCMSLVLLITYISFYQRQIWDAAEQERELIEKKAQLTDMRTKLMVSQVQPHFMYNTLSSIAYYCKKNPDLAKQLTMDFSNYLRHHIDSLDGESMILFSKELEHTKTYLNIEQVRFGERLQVVYDIGYFNFTLPLLSLQPIVENAVKHGVCKKEEGGIVTIRTEKTADGVLISVIDDGVGFHPNQIENDGKSHFGIRNVKERIEQFCHGSLEIQSEIGAGTIARIFIPEKNLNKP